MHCIRKLHGVEGSKNYPETGSPRLKTRLY
jgi:hypothetical protein